MNIYNVGPDELDECSLSYLPQDTVWVVYHYTIGDYCGDGQAVVLTKNKELYIATLGHCSCYGPIESPKDFYKTTSEKYLSSFSDVTENYNCHVYDKVKELLLKESNNEIK